MSHLRPFARAFPKLIRLTERYSYKTVMSNLFQTEPVLNPTGLIEIVTPYDGWKHFTRNAIADIITQTQTLKSNQFPSNASIGHLSLTHHENTNLDELLLLVGKNNVIPLNIPISGNGLHWPYSFSNDKQSAHITINYIPKYPNIIPVYNDFFVYDEDAVDVMKELTEPVYKNENIVIKRISRQISFEGSLIFIFQFFLELELEQAKNLMSLPQLTQMNLEWPVAVSYRRVHLAVDSKAHHFVYHPRLGVLQWGNIHFEPVEIIQGKNVLCYRTPFIELRIDEPGELYKQFELNGKVLVEIPCLLSGLQAGYFDVSGKYYPEIKIELKSLVSIEMNLLIIDSFEQRHFSPQQQLQFPELILDELRLADIVMLLKDERFTIHSNPLNNETIVPKGKHLITASRPEGADRLTLWIVVDGTPSNTTREREIPGGEVFTTDLETGNTTIYIRGQLARDGQRVVKVINQIHNRLKERFRHVRVIE